MTKVKSKENSSWVSGDFSLWLIDNTGGPVNINLRQAEYLEMKFNGWEWAQLFYEVLNCPKADKYNSEDNFHNWFKKNEEKFRKSINKYPMLGELHHTYSQIIYNQEQVKKLLEEVIEVIPTAVNNNVALKGLSKLKKACEKAIEKGKFLYLNG